LDAVLECDTHREAAALMKLHPARITQLLSGAATCGPSVRARLAAVL
jgi:plasmid maintenance system antidote protein VapI